MSAGKDRTWGNLTRDEMIRLLKMSCFIKKNGCWFFTGAKNKEGFGVMTIDKQPMGAHEVSYEVFVEDRKYGQLVMHSCKDFACINPKHLYVFS